MGCYRKNCSWVTVLFLNLNACSVMAGDLATALNHFSDFLPKSIASSLVISVSVDPVWENAGHTQKLYLQPEIQKTYVANSGTNGLVDGELFIGIQRTLNTRVQGQLGLAVATTSNANLSGAIWDDANPAFDNFVYTYQVQHTHIALKGKLLTETSYHTTKPYIAGSIGVGFNRASCFSNTPTLFQALVNPDFASNTTASFTYTIGVGLQKILTPHWQVGVGYEFADWGSNQLSQAEGQTIGNGPSMSHLYTNGIMFNLTWNAE